MKKMFPPSTTLTVQIVSQMTNSCHYFKTYKPRWTLCQMKTNLSNLTGVDPVQVTCQRNLHITLSLVNLTRDTVGLTGVARIGGRTVLIKRVDTRIMLVSRTGWEGAT